MNALTRRTFLAGGAAAAAAGVAAAACGAHATPPRTRLIGARDPRVGAVVVEVVEEASIGEQPNGGHGTASRGQVRRRLPRRLRPG